VVIDVAVLDTLPSREVLAGLAEVIKYGVIEDPALFNLLEEKLDAALDAYTKARTLKADDPKVHSTIGRILFQKGDLTGSLAAARLALRHNADLIEAHELLIDIFQKQGKAAEAARQTQILERLRAKR